MQLWFFVVNVLAGIFNLLKTRAMRSLTLHAIHISTVLSGNAYTIKIKIDLHTKYKHTYIYKQVKAIKHITSAKIHTTIFN